MLLLSPLRYSKLNLNTAGLKDIKDELISLKGIALHSKIIYTDEQEGAAALKDIVADVVTLRQILKVAADIEAATLKSLVNNLSRQLRG
jgi:hypothetical protein